MRRLKVVVTGPFNSGKTEFIKTLSEIDVVSTEKKITVPELAAIKGETTVAMDFGKITRGNDKIYIFGTPGQQHLDIMWEVLTENMLGFVVVVDSTDTKRFKEAKEIIKVFSEILEEPYVVAANKQDLPGALSVDELRKDLDMKDDAVILPCVATDKSKATAVLSELIGEI
jgi:small GTP-binding protein